MKNASPVIVANLIRMALVEYVVERTPRSRIHLADDHVKMWVDEYLTAHESAMAETIANLTLETLDLEELPRKLPGFWLFMKRKDPELFERPTGIY